MEDSHDGIHPYPVGNKCRRILTEYGGFTKIEVAIMHQEVYYFLVGIWSWNYFQ
jgi:hypothetical protein